MTSDSLPDADLAPLEPPSALIALPAGMVAVGCQVVALPTTNPAHCPVLKVVGFPGQGWYLKVTDSFGTLVWSIMLQGLADETLDGMPEL